MKFFVYAFVTILSLSAVHAKDLNCKSQEQLEGWNGGNTYDHLYLHSIVKGKDLLNPRTSGAYEADFLGKLQGALSKNTKWTKFKTLEDAWCWYSVTLPTGFQLKKPNQVFVGYVDRICEDGYGQKSVKMSCSF